MLLLPPLLVEPVPSFIIFSYSIMNFNNNSVNCLAIFVVVGVLLMCVLPKTEFMVRPTKRPSPMKKRKSVGGKPMGGGLMARMRRQKSLAGRR